MNSCMLKCMVHARLKMTSLWHRVEADVHNTTEGGTSNTSVHPEAILWNKTNEKQVHLSYFKHGSELEGPMSESVRNPLLISNQRMIDMYSSIQSKLHQFSSGIESVLHRAINPHSSKSVSLNAQIASNIAAECEEMNEQAGILLQAAVKTHQIRYPSQKIIG